jgi:hypothetical protein
VALCYCLFSVPYVHKAKYSFFLAHFKKALN